MSWRAVLNVMVVIVSSVVIFFWANEKLSWTPRACEEPIAYTIGNFDRKFGLSQKDFLSALTKAEEIWEKPLGKELFTYAPEEGELTINLIYDYRQETTKTLSNIEYVVKEDEATYKTLQHRYEKLKTEYDNAKSIYETQVNTFKKNNEAYDTKVESWNRSPRTSKVQFDDLEKDRMTLETEVGELRILETRLGEMVRKINSLVGTLNYLAQVLNLNVKTYNTIGAARGETFTGGLYNSAGGSRAIDIYEFSSREKLVRVMAHELGHALGLEHVDNPKAIMYQLNEGDTGILSEVDLAALKALCYTKDIKN